MNKTINLTVDLREFDECDIKEYAIESLDLFENLSDVDTVDTP